MINHVSFQGRFTKDPELKHTANDIPYVNSSLAWSEKYGENKNTCFLNFIAYRNAANFLSKYFKKGDMVLMEGKLVTRKYKDQNGNNKFTTDLIVDKTHFCGPKIEQQDESNIQTMFDDDDDDDDLPFQ